MSPIIVADEDEFKDVAAWQAYRNAANRLINWPFTTNDTRIKLRQLSAVKIDENQQLRA